MNTRGLTGLSTNRITSEIILLRYVHETDTYGDGAVIINYTELLCQASVGILQPRDIERLEKGGIIIRSGVTIAIRQSPEKRPDTITYDGKAYRVVAWAFDKEYESASFDAYDVDATNYGSVIATCDEITITGADA